MNHKERVLATINHEIPDKVPKGELGIELDLMQRILKDEFHTLDEFQREVEVRKRLNMDLIVINEFPMVKIKDNDDESELYTSSFGEHFIKKENQYRTVKPALKDITKANEYNGPDFSLCTTNKVDYYVNNTDLFVFATIGGPISTLDWMFGMEEFMIYAMTDIDNLDKIAKKVVDFEIKRAKLFIDHGVDAIMVTDDIAYNQGLFFPPQVMKKIGYYYYKKIVKEIKSYKNIPVFMHTDGDINSALGDILSCGFDGLQSLQPSAGMDIKEVKKEYGKDLCLMGNLDLNRLLPFGTVEEVKQVVRDTIDVAAAGGGYILSTCNIFIDAIKEENAIAMYETAEEYGVYSK